MDQQDEVTSTQEELNCTIQYTGPGFTAAAIIRAMNGSISFIASLFVISLILYHKRYIIFAQRLILYLSISTMLKSLIEATQWRNNGTLPFKNYCLISAFLIQVTNWSVLLGIFSIAANLYIVVFTRKVRRAWHDCLYVGLIFLFPLTFNWIPFLDNRYGIAGPWCWIRMDDGNCTTNVYGWALRYLLWYVPLVVTIVVTVLLYVAIYWKIRKERYKYRGIYCPQAIKINKMMNDEVKPLAWYPLVYLVLNTFPVIVNRILEDLYSQSFPAVWIIQGFFTPLTGAFITLIYTLDNETRKRLSKCSLRGELGKLRQSDNVSEYPLRQCNTDSYLRSVSFSFVEVVNENVVKSDYCHMSD